MGSDAPLNEIDDPPHPTKKDGGALFQGYLIGAEVVEIHADDLAGLFIASRHNAGLVVLRKDINARVPRLREPLLVVPIEEVGSA